MERIDKIIASCSDYSRKEVKYLIHRGAVLADGSVVHSPDQKLDPEQAVITVCGERLTYEKFVYIMLNKPAGVVSSTDERGAKTVLDLVDAQIRRRKVFPAGRLDRDTTGFVLLTDDGAFAHDILSPARHVPKTYRLTAVKRLTDAQIAQITAGQTMDGEQLQPCELRLLRDGDTPEYEIIIRQGKYHQIKRMFAQVGNGVLALRRTALGGLPLDDALAEGEYRALTPQEKQMITRV